MKKLFFAILLTLILTVSLQAQDRDVRNVFFDTLRTSDFQPTPIGVDDMKFTASSPDFAQPEFGIPAKTTMHENRDWRDTVLIDVLARWQTTKHLQLWARAGYRSPASPDRTIDAASPDGHRIGLGFGTNYTLIRYTEVIMDAGFQSIIPRNVVTSENDIGNGKYKLMMFMGGLYFNQIF